ncbi:hypothetical protein ABH944_008564 [Caballeronia udeis]|uniref:Uncharacterized protein n=1 Tax=Caballeronia udeis TaxID=1232866 RepID=A0ABW8MXK7_9BURK
MRPGLMTKKVMTKYESEYKNESFGVAKDIEEVVTVRLPAGTESR